MQDHEVREKLRHSLSDGQLDRAERDGLRDWLARAVPDGQKRAVYQAMAFELAREAMERAPVNPHAILNWLERVVKLLTPLAPAGANPIPAEACFSPHHDCAARVGRLFDNARKTVDVCVFTITDDRISDALLRAHRRGVRLRVITDNDKQFDPGSDIERLGQAGIEVRQDHSRFHMHHKFAIFDEAILLTGSYNWTRSAAQDNEENFILTADARLLRAFTGLFDELWGRFEPGQSPPPA